MKVLIACSLLIFTCLSFSGCSVFMAAHQPDYKDLSFLKAGVSRDKIVSELGSPAATQTDEQGNAVDIYKFKQGYGTGNKALRMLGHGTADFFSLGLWEIVGTPAEAICNGKEMAVKVTYDTENKAQDIVYLTGK